MLDRHRQDRQGCLDRRAIFELLSFVKVWRAVGSSASAHKAKKNGESGHRLKIFLKKEKADHFPIRARTSASVAARKILAVLSKLPEASIRPSGEKATEKT